MFNFKKQTKKNENLVLTRYKDLRGVYQIEIINNTELGYECIGFMNFTDVHIKIVFPTNSFENFLISFGKEEKPNEIQTNEMKLIGEELIKIHEFIEDVKVDYNYIKENKKWSVNL